MKWTRAMRAAATVLLAAIPASTSLGRGFGGFHGGMRLGGSFGSMPFHGGGMPGGYGGMRMNAFGARALGGAMIPGLSPMAGMRYGANIGRPQLGGLGYGGMNARQGARWGSLGSRPLNLGGWPHGLARPNSLSGPGRAGRGELAGGPSPGGFPGGRSRGFGTSRSEMGGTGARRPLGREGLATRPGRQGLDKFLGLPSDGGLHALAGRHLGPDVRGLSRLPDASRRELGDRVRNGFRRGDFYSDRWYRRYAYAWYPTLWAYGGVWDVTPWNSLYGWLGYSNAQPIDYDYGNNITYQDDAVYMDGEAVGTADEYYQQAQDLATQPARKDDSPDAQTDEAWMPLGVFAMTHDAQDDANLVLQLAVNQQGIIRGNYTAKLTDDTLPVKGHVDKKTQRAAWTIGNQTRNVLETGIYNLTHDEVPLLVHFGKDRTEQWLLVRLKPDKADPPDTADHPAPANK